MAWGVSFLLRCVAILAWSKMGVLVRVGVGVCDGFVVLVFSLASALVPSRRRRQRGCQRKNRQQKTAAARSKSKKARPKRTGLRA